MPRPQTNSGGIFFDIPRKQVISRKIPPESPPLMPFPWVTASGRPEGLPFAPTPGYSDKGFLRNRGGISWRIIPGNYGGFGGNWGSWGIWGIFGKIGRDGDYGNFGNYGMGLEEGDYLGMGRESQRETISRVAASRGGTISGMRHLISGAVFFSSWLSSGVMKVQSTG